ncbi:MAG: uroporphyrinogen-III synthase [Burkholderiaceae bacterium]|jgi:uroporphyrinogen-III synthase|nr:uroporphyrinogen-III synthase [Burkholderiaceae bacterium]
MLNTTLIFTRVPAQQGGAQQIFGPAGVQVLDFPLQHIGPPPDLARFHAALAVLPQTDLAVPVSPTAVAAVFAALPGPWPSRCAIGVVGDGSLRAVRRALTAQPEDVPWPRLIAPETCEEQGGEGDSEALWRALQLAFAPGPVASFPWAGRHVQIYRGGPGRDLLARKLEDAGAKVKVIEAYSRLAPQYNAQTAAQLQAALGCGGWWLFSSTEAVRNLQSLLAQAAIAPALLQQQRALAIHPRIAQTLRDAGFGRVELTAAPPDAVLSTLRRLSAST